MSESTPSGNAPLRLVAKLAEVMAAVRSVPKRGRNEFHKYDYAMEADIVAAIRQELAARKVMLLPSCIGSQRIPIGDKGQALTEIEMTFTFYDGESDEALTCTWRGAGADKEDKGLYKAMTGAEKYFLLKTFLIPTGDDPELDEPQPRQRKPQATAPNTDDGRIVNAQQMRRLKEMIRTHNTNIDELKAWMKARFGYDHAEQIQRQHYDAITRYVTEGVDVTNGEVVGVH